MFLKIGKVEQELVYNLDRSLRLGKNERAKILETRDRGESR